MTTFRKAALLAVFLSALGLAFAHAATAQAPPLTNQDVIKMVRADLSPDIIRTTIQSAVAVDFDVSPDGLIALKAAGVGDDIITSMQGRVASASAPTRLGAPEKSAPFATARDPATILRTFRTMTVDAREASFFGTAQMIAALRKQKDFDTLGITIVDDTSLADVVLQVSYTFAWDYPFKLLHQNSSVVLLSGTGSGPFSGPAGAASVADKLVKQLKPYRTRPSSTSPSSE